MAISSQLIGALGAAEVTQSKFWFSDSNRRAESLDKSWNVPRGNYLFVWRGTPRNAYGGDSRIFINGQVLAELDPAGKDETGGFVYLENVTSIVLTGEGRKRFMEDPEAAFVRVN